METLFPYGFKKCTQCHELKSINDFGKDKTLKSGLRSYCKECSNRMRRDWMKRNKHKEQEYNVKYRPKVAKKYREKKAELQILNKCEICGDSLIGRDLNTKYCKKCKPIIKAKWRKKDYEVNRQTYINNYIRNKPKIIEQNRIKNQKRRDNISDHYVRKLLREKSGFTVEQIEQNPELIEVKRLIIKTKRL
jgi:predicted Rdx family selenoprotein